MAQALYFSLTLLVSSSLLFVLQPMCAKMILPFLGGSPGVWNTCMVFFQAGLLLGYGYAHYVPARLGIGRHALIHLLLFMGAWFTLPIVIDAPAAAPAWPAWWLLGVLTVAVGPMYVLLASTGPLVQRWFAAGPDVRNPYFLYAASNLGSFLGLVSYPFLIEPNLTLAQQSCVGMWLFAGLIVLLAGCALWLRRGKVADVANAEVASARAESATWRGTKSIRLRWLLLAMVPASLMLSVTSYLTADIAPMPLLWIIPIALYLLTFTFVFAQRQVFPHWLILRWLPVAVLLIAVMLLAEATVPIGLILSLHLLAFFWVSMACHGELARTKPPATHLTEFFLFLALGGVLGGMFNALIAPVVFPTFAEYPLMLVLACWLVQPDAGDESAGKNPWTLKEYLPTRLDWIAGLACGLGTLLLVGLVRVLEMPGGSLALAVAFGPAGIVCLLMAERPIRFALCLGGLLLASNFYAGVFGTPEYRQRSFFGVHRVTKDNGFHVLIHGNTVHGKQWLDPGKRDIPLTYYYPTGPVGQLLTGMKGDPRLQRVGLVGLGTGALAAYTQPGEHWSFFEIDPVVQRIAEDPGLFTYLHDCSGNVDVQLGDARLTLTHADDTFGVLIIDAFGSDSIPLHLLTTEAMQVYERRLSKHGILVFHISNRYLDLEPILANFAAKAGWVCRVRADMAGSEEIRKEWEREGKFESIWAVLARDEADLPVRNWLPGQTNPRIRPWTDDFSNIFQVLKRNE